MLPWLKRDEHQHSKIEMVVRAHKAKNLIWRRILVLLNQEVVLWSSRIRGFWKLGYVQSLISETNWTQYEYDREGGNSFICLIEGAVRWKKPKQKSSPKGTGPRGKSFFKILPHIYLFDFGLNIWGPNACLCFRGHQRAGKNSLERSLLLRGPGDPVDRKPPAVIISTIRLPVSCRLVGEGRRWYLLGGNVFQCLV